MRKAGKILLAAGILVLSGAILLKILAPSGFSGKVLFFKVSFHDLEKPINFSFNLIFSGVLFIFISKNTWPDWKVLTLLFFAFTSLLKILRYEFFLAPGYDLGNYVSILHNIYRHGRLFDSLNQVHAFSGHIRPFLFPLSLVFAIKESPVTLLLLQSAVVSLTIPVILKISRFYKLTPDAARLVAALFVSNIYLHHVNGFDFHLEALAIPLILLGIYFLEVRNLILSALTMAVTLTFKEDIAITWLSVGLYYLFVRKDRGRGALVSGFAVFYGILSAYLISRFVEFQTMQKAHYSAVPHLLEILKSGFKFLASFGFLPLFVPGAVVAWILPFLEHLTSSRPHHYKIHYQYSANLLPVVFWNTILAMKRNTRFVKGLVILAIIFSIFQNPLKMYIDLTKLDLSKREYIKKILSGIPEDARVSCGNHISPHLATRDGVFQFPIIDDADLIILDTTWHDYTPITEDSAITILENLIKSGKYAVLSDSMGILVLKKDSIITPTLVLPLKGEESKVRIVPLKGEEKK